MRKKILAQSTIFDHAINLLITMFNPSKKLKMIDTIIDDNPFILAAVHTDLTNGSIDSGSHGMRAELILRCAILKQFKHYTYRELQERLEDGISFQRVKVNFIVHNVEKFFLKSPSTES